MLIPQPAAAGTADTDGDGLRDAFEVRYGLDPNRADSDHDGLLDPAEDLDHDGLSNLAEQRFHTNPRKRDTDHDGIGDAMEDANHDGIPNWKQQDTRPVPKHLDPAPANAGDDNYCYQIGTGSTGNCTGDPDGTRTVAIYGDSHAGQWIAALQIIATQRHWRLVSYAKSSCPSVHVDATGTSYDADCRGWRGSSEKAMRQHPPDLVVVTNYSHYDVTPKLWKTGLGATLAALPATSHVVVLADTPASDVYVPACLKKHPDNLGACETPRSKVYLPGHDDLERNVASQRGASFTSINPWLCPTKLCPVVVGHFLMYRDGSHITVPYAKQMAPALGSVIAPLMP